MPEDLSFSDADRSAVYRAIALRRDVRRGFLNDPLPEKLLDRLLAAAHHAPSVGFMQPSRFIVIRNRAIRQTVYDCFVSPTTSFPSPISALAMSMSSEASLNYSSRDGKNVSQWRPPSSTTPMMRGPNHESAFYHGAGNQLACRQVTACRGVVSHLCPGRVSRSALQVAKHVAELSGDARRT
ncbi:nitroreductase family protein [Terriglobus sp. YAF25]|uniref:nitroreductase family protein n=1 Tax=Terriglobus sp. YAF25 TaxID=3233080 RepID=UPI003F94A79F